MAPGPTLLHALSAVVPTNVASIGEHGASRVTMTPQVAGLVALPTLPTSHYAPAGHGAARHGGVRVLRWRRPRDWAFLAHGRVHMHSRQSHALRTPGRAGHRW